VDKLPKTLSKNTDFQNPEKTEAGSSPACGGFSYVYSIVWKYKELILELIHRKLNAS
jgi:hypothetical protein